ncbi:unnamed protein product [Didymodactylos carnosus]|uniref:G-protein coupled receptors family 1 profile domain-containing protein n=1 Tax=Didymodactylos carnosus TaxID=1234261 RepID=A0A8S2K4E7_9BILA|nr:unnamed protein product [Didymodactylos carnosus]CAF3828545.1 unnamed protein product [Didymodactylos carnosus]
MDSKSSPPYFDYILATKLSTLISNLNRYFSLCLLICGTIGGILNILTFTRRSLNTNPCTSYFLASSISDLIVIYSGLLGRFPSSLNINPTFTSPVLCKLQFYLLYSSLSLSSWFILSASVDRFLSSCRNARIRNLSTKKSSYHVVIILTICSLLIWLEVFYCYDANLPIGQGILVPCFTHSNQCALFNSIFVTVVQNLAPALLMTLFGLLTVSNIKTISQQIVPSIIVASSGGVPSTHRMKQKDRQITIMLLVQVTLLTVDSMLIPVFSFYQYATSSSEKSATQLFIENAFVLQLLLLLSFLHSSSTFFIYTLSGKIFRKELNSLFFSTCKRLGLRNVQQRTDVTNTENNSTLNRNRMRITTISIQ